MAGVYEFSNGFQEKILSLMWREPSFYVVFSDCIKPQYFESDIHIDIARILTSYYVKYDKSPTLEAVVEEVRELTNSSKLKREKEEEYGETLIRLVEMDLSDSEFIKDKVVKFGKKQALTEAILKSVDDLKSASDFSVIEDRITKANQVGQDIGDFGTFYFDTVDERMQGYHRRDTEKVPTGLDILDTKMAGGLGKGELGVVIAPPGTGKTLSLINIGANAIMSGYNVAHFSLEMSEERVTQRYDSSFTDKNFEYIKENGDKVASALKMLAKARKGKLVVKSYPTRTCSLAMIKSYLSRIKLATGFVPDIIIIDYADLLRPSSTYKERRTELEILYEEIRGLGQQIEAAIWTASQTNRGALEKKVVTIADLAESFGKAAVADFMIAISQTKEEKKNGELRYYIAKSRNGESDATLHFDVAYDKMKLRSNHERQAVFELDEDDVDEDTTARRKKMMDASKRTKKTAENNGNAVASEVLNMMKQE